MKKAILLITMLALITSFTFAQGSNEPAEPENQVVKFWYHFDDPETALNPLIEKFEKENPGIEIEPERISWDVYNQKLLTAVAGGYPPDVAQVKLWWQPQLVEMGALLSLDDYIAEWDGKDDFGDKIGRGTYVYKVKVIDNEGNKVEKYEKLVLLK